MGCGPVVTQEEQIFSGPKNIPSWPPLRCCFHKQRS